MEELIIKSQNGDEWAFKQLIENIQNDLYKVARTRLRNEEDIKDAIQNTMILAFNNIKKIRQIEYFKSWIIKILINECNKLYNMHKKNNEIFDKFSKEINTYDEGMSTIQSKMDFEDLISSLSYDERIIITLYYNSQFSCNEIAKTLNANVHTIKSKLNRSKAKLRKRCEEGKRYDM